MPQPPGPPAVCPPSSAFDHAALAGHVARGVLDFHVAAGPRALAAGRPDLDEVRRRVDAALPHLLSAYGVFGDLVPADAKPFADFAIDALVRLMKLADRQAAGAVG